MSFPKCDPSVERKTLLRLHVEHSGDAYPPCFGHRTSYSCSLMSWWSCEHMVTADRGIFAFTFPTLGSWPISSRPEGANQGPAFRVSCIKAEPDAELAGPPTPFLNPAEP